MGSNTAEDCEVRERAKRWMEKKGLNQLTLAELSGMSASTLNKFFNDENRKITLKDIISIGIGLGINPALLLTDEDFSLVVDEQKPMSLASIFTAIHYLKGEPEEMERSISVDLPYTMLCYSKAKPDQIETEVHFRNVRGKYSKQPVFSLMPFVLLSAKGEGQAFKNLLRVGYWFSKDGERVYLAIHYAAQGFSVAGRDMSEQANITMPEYFRAIASDYITINTNMRMMDGALSDPYARGCIHCIQYDLASIPDNETLKDQFQQMFDLYITLLNAAAERMSETYQGMFISMVADIKREQPQRSIDTKAGKAELDRIIPIVSEDMYPPSRRLKSVASALIREDYKCEADSSHVTFTDRSTGKPYIEVHALVPLNYQEKFKASLRGASANMICLCPTCHKMIRNADDSVREEMLLKLYMKHKDELKEAGIEVSMMQILKWYGLS